MDALETRWHFCEYYHSEHNIATHFWNRFRKINFHHQPWGVYKRCVTHPMKYITWTFVQCSGRLIVRSLITSFDVVCNRDILEVLQRTIISTAFKYFSFISVIVHQSPLYVITYYTTSLWISCFISSMTHVDQRNEFNFFMTFLHIFSQCLVISYQVSSKNFT